MPRSDVEAAPRVTPAVDRNGDRTDDDLPAAPAAQAAIDLRILEAVRTLDYGSVEIVVHDSQVVQIERREKLRFDKPVPPDAASGKRAARSRRPRQSEPRAQ